MQTIQIEIHDGNQPITINLPADADAQRLMSYLAGHTQFREDASRFVYEAKRSYPDYVKRCGEYSTKPVEFLEYLAKVREQVDTAMLDEYRQQQAVMESIKPAIDTGMFGMIKAHPAELTTGPSSGRCKNGDQCGCFWDQGDPVMCANYVRE